MNIFIGDSHVAGWDLNGAFPGRSTANYGISGERITQIQKRLSLFSPIESNCFIIAGTNDLTAGSSRSQEIVIAEMISDYNVLFQTASSRFKKTYMISVFPVGRLFLCEPCKSTRSTIPIINDSLKSIIERNFPNVKFIDVAQYLRESDDFFKSGYTDDGLHLSDKGYELLSTEVRQYVR